MKYDEPTRPIRIALYATIQGDWERADGALSEAISLVRQRKAQATREASKA
jgi:hypothetical protein